MAQTYEIPLAANAQRFGVVLAGITYRFTLQWRDCPPLNGGWVLDIADVNDAPLVTGIALTTGEDLLAQYGHLELGFSLYVQSDSDPSLVPTYADLGKTAHLYAVF